MMRMEKLLYTIHETAEMLSVSVSTVNRMIVDNAIKPVKVKGRTLFYIEELKRFAREGYTPKKEKKPEEPMDQEAVELMKKFNL